MIRRLLTIGLIIGVTATGCSLLEGPEMNGVEGSLSLRFVSEANSVWLEDERDPRMRLALPTADSILVKVFRPGTGPSLEKSKGAAISPPADTVDIQLTVVAEDNKRVAVQLYQAGSMVYFGVNENVDVKKNANTNVSIIASRFQTSGFWRTEAWVSEGTAFDFMWNSVSGATTYRVQGSLAPDFSTIDIETTVSDTTLSVPAGALPKGEYWFRVAAENVYTRSEFSLSQHIDVYGAPVITSMSVPEAIRLQEVTLYGEDLDFPGTEVWFYGKPATVSASSRDSLVFSVPLNSFSDSVEVKNNAGSGFSNMLKVQTIAYIMGTLASGDLTSASIYKSMIDSYGDVILNSHAIILPYTWMDFVPMSIFELIIVGWDTGTQPSTWAGNVQSRVDSVARSGAAVMGIGVGGASYLERAKLNIGWGSAFTFVQRNIYCSAPAAPIYNVPNTISIPPSRILDIYVSDVTVLAIDENPSAPSDPSIRFYGAINQVTNLFPFIQETSTAGPRGVPNYLWGFQESPVSLTLTGLLIFENTVKHLFDAGAADALP